MLYPVILVGGSGTRLWPLSRRSMPKQFLPLASQYSLLQDTLSRLNGLEPLASPVFVCNQEHRFLVAEQVREVGVTPEALLLEPIARNTAPAIAAAALLLVQKTPDALMLVFAVRSRHRRCRGVSGRRATRGKKRRAMVFSSRSASCRIARKPATATFSAAPRCPMTRARFAFSRFVEKPDEATAESYVASGDYSWNSGMFLFRAQVFLDELEKYHPEILSSTRLAVEGAYSDLDFLPLGRSCFSIVARAVDRRRCDGKKPTKLS